MNDKELNDTSPSLDDLKNQRNERLASYQELIGHTTQMNAVSDDGAADKVDDKIKKINSQYTKNEKQKRHHRSIILVIVLILVCIQMLFFNIVVVGILISVTSNTSWFKTMDYETTKLLLDFLKYYISVTVVELLGMLLFIIKNLFNFSQKQDIIKSNKKSS